MNKAINSKQSPAAYLAFSLAAAATAAGAAACCLVFGVPVWAMFVGWVAFFTRGLTARDGAVNFACVAFGTGIGIAAAIAIGMLQPTLGKMALPAVVFVVATLVVSLRAAPMFNNILAYFLGLIAFFAAHMEPTLGTLIHLASASALGCFAGWVSMKLQQGLPRSA
ncbi:MAG: DUF1097 domain-containing protein [Pseudomonadota bacterium]